MLESHFTQSLAALCCAALFLMPPQASAACLSPPGDVSADGAANVVDVQCMINTVLYAPVIPGCNQQVAEASNLNCDSSTNIIDVLIAINYALGAALDPLLDADGNGCPDACAGGGPVFPTCAEIGLAVADIEPLACDGFTDGVLTDKVYASKPDTTLSEINGDLRADSTVGGAGLGLLLSGNSKALSLRGLAVDSFPDGASLRAEFYGEEAGDTPALLVELSLIGGPTPELVVHVYSKPDAQTTIIKASELGLADLSLGALLSAHIMLDDKTSPTMLWAMLEGPEGTSALLGPYLLDADSPGAAANWNFSGVEVSTDQASIMLDGVAIYGDLPTEDFDGDSLANPTDLCPGVFEIAPADLDQDEVGDLCDDDDDGDGVGDGEDLCPEENSLYLDADQDGCKDTLEQLGEFVTQIALSTEVETLVVSKIDEIMVAYATQVPGGDEALSGTTGGGTSSVDLTQSLLEVHTLLEGSLGAEFAENAFISSLGALDSDTDGSPDALLDNCPTLFNPSQVDGNGNGLGEACDPDEAFELSLFYPLTGDSVGDNQSLLVSWSSLEDELESLTLTMENAGGLTVESTSLSKGRVFDEVHLWEAGSVPGGPITLTVEATSEAGVVSSASVDVVVDQRPYVDFTVAAAGASSIELNASSVTDPEGLELGFSWDIAGETFSGNTLSYSPGEGSSGGGISPGPTGSGSESFLANLTVSEPSGRETQSSQLITMLTDSMGNIEDVYTGDPVTAEPFCGCASMEVRTQAGDTSGTYGAGSIPLGADPPAGTKLDFSNGQKPPVRFQMEVSSTLVDGSTESLCDHVQEVKRTSTLGPTITRHGKDRNTGKEMPYAGNEMGNDNYDMSSRYLEEGGGEIRWRDRPGAAQMPDSVLNLGFTYDAAFYAKVSGDRGTCECTWEVHIAIDKQGKVTKNEASTPQCTGGGSSGG